MGPPRDTERRQNIYYPSFVLFEWIAESTTTHNDQVGGGGNKF